jgi:diadenosine tetraphosphatase ApaH/serine/threonine PP2A family protein phosphatase
MRDARVRYGILGDIHSNLAALDAVLGALEALRVDRYLCLGDIVGYGADARECVDRVRQLGPAIVAGNHDWAVGERLPLDFFNAHARAAITWTRRVLPRESVAWLATLDLLHVEGDVTLAHSTVHDPDVFDYLQTPYDAYLSFRAMATRDGFVGHSHIPVTFFDGTPITYAVGSEIEFGERRTISNVGSVGQPRDEDPRASYGVFDTASRVLEIRRVEYDVEATVARIRAAGLPPILAERLRLGR